MKIEEYISELLFEHDCVIVPDFGGFVCNYAPAHIDPVKHLFEPPGKRIIFNKGLTRNDGLLAHHISGKLKLSYSGAVESITKEVKQLKEDIKQNKRLVLENIGLLYMDEKGNLLFQQDNKVNYLTESFGLSAFYHLPIEQKAESDSKIIPLYNERKKIRIYATAAVVTTLVVSAFGFSLLEKETNIHFSSFNFFSKKEVPEYVFTNTYKNLPAPVSEPFTIVEIKPAVPAAITVSPVAPNNSIANTSIPTLSSHRFSVIVGCFMVKSNAENLINKYTQQNLPVSILGTTPQGLYMVGYGNFQSLSDASAERNTFAKKFNADVWVKAY